MHALIIHCHPEPRSFNAALTAISRQTLEQQGYTVTVSDLYADGFNPVEGPARYANPVNPDYFSVLDQQRHSSEADTLPVAVWREIKRLERADRVIFQFPLWWHGTPAMLKGWFDRVFVYGGLYTGRMRYDRGYFRGRRAICSITTGAPASVFTRGGRGGGEIPELLHPTLFSLHYMGFDVLSPFCAHGVQGGGQDVAYLAGARFSALLEDHKKVWARRLENLETETPLTYPNWKDWDAHGVPKPGTMRQAGVCR